MAAPESKNKRKHRVLFVLEMLLLTLFLGILFLYGQITARLGELSAPAATSSGELQEQQSFNEAEIVTNHTAPRMTGYRTVAFFGLDHRSKNEELNSENSDTIIICSVNNDTQDVKMVSIYRDTLLDIGDDIYSKANSAYAYGGPVQAVSMLNTNLDLDITDYVTVDFNAVVELVDAVDGLDIPLSYAEIVHMNNYCVETAEETGKDYEPIELPANEPADLEKVIGTYHLNGVQATSYCRIRYTANLDMGRTERQRRVIQLVTQKLKKVGLARIFRIMDAVFPMIKTSLTKTEILSMIPQMISYRVDSTTGFPFQYKFSDIKGSIIVADTLKDNVIMLHDFLYGRQKSYVPSDNILEISSNILEIVGGESGLQEDAPIVDENTGIDNFYWTYGSSEPYTESAAAADSSGYDSSSYVPADTSPSYGTWEYDGGDSTWGGNASGYDSYQGSSEPVYSGSDEGTGGQESYDGGQESYSGGYDTSEDSGYVPEEGAEVSYDAAEFTDGSNDPGMAEGGNLAY